MFFILSKILTFLFSPFTYVFILLVWAWLTKNHTLRKKLLFINLIFTFVFGNSFLYEEVSRIWELPVNKDINNSNFNYGIILGGIAEYDAANNKIQFNCNADRLLQTLPKIENGRFQNIIYSGGSGDLYHPENKEAELIKKYLESINYDISNFLWETKSRNTYENAKYCSQLIKTNHPNYNELKIAIITSSIHMRRSLACFRKQGLNVTYFSTNRHSGPRHFDFNHIFVPQISVLKSWNHLAHEILGYVSYRLTGKL